MLHDRIKKNNNIQYLIKNTGVKKIHQRNDRKGTNVLWWYSTNTETIQILFDFVLILMLLKIKQRIRSLEYPVIV